LRDASSQTSAARLAALALAVFSLVAALFFHAELGDQNQMIHFLKNIAIAGGLLQVAAFGGGPVSIDGVLAQRRVAVVNS
jgi:putative oxidoreductase